MEGKCSPVIEEVGAPNVMEVPRLEEPVVSSSSGGSSSSGSESDADAQEEGSKAVDRSESDADAQEEGSKAVDPRESSLSYVFGPSTITVGRIQKMASLGYFPEGTTREPGEEVVSELVEDEAIIFEEFFCIRAPHAPFASPCQHSTQVLGPDPPANPQRYCSIIQVLLGGAELRRCANQRWFHQVL
jgi:hypothetical protein